MMNPVKITLPYTMSLGGAPDYAGTYLCDPFRGLPDLVTRELATLWVEVYEGHRDHLRQGSDFPEESLSILASKLKVSEWEDVSREMGHSTSWGWVLFRDQSPVVHHDTLVNEGIITLPPWAGTARIAIEDRNERAKRLGVHSLWDRYRNDTGCRPVLLTDVRDNMTAEWVQALYRRAGIDRKPEVHLPSLPTSLWKFGHHVEAALRDEYQAGALPIPDPAAPARSIHTYEDIPWASEEERQELLHHLQLKDMPAISYDSTPAPVGDTPRIRAYQLMLGLACTLEEDGFARLPHIFPAQTLSSYWMPEGFDYSVPLHYYLPPVSQGEVVRHKIPTLIYDCDSEMFHYKSILDYHSLFVPSRARGGSL